MRADVVLVPGLWAPGATMALLALRLVRAGYRPHIFSYRGRSPFDANVDRLAKFLPHENTHYVGHSLGGVMVLEMLNRYPQVRARSALLIAAPACGSFSGRRFAGHRAGRWMMGASRPLWEPREARWLRREPLGVIAGTLPLGLGRAFGSLPGANDGVVCVSETTVDGAAASVLVPEGHSALIVSGRTGRLVEKFLASGRFE